MDWINKYRFINKHEYHEYPKHLDWNNEGYMDYLFDQPLYKFKFNDEITEDEFLNGTTLYLINDECIWCIKKNLVVISLKQIRKEKLDGLDKKI
jgi:hypothetical protein